MKIVSVRFKNINSLYGEWSIDFSDPAYSAETIFVISGPTGSGKTTLLDAVCLALYGKTPRLDVISKSTNEIMTKQTSECFAEVLFQTGKRLFRAHWSQHRARRKKDGDLQQPRHELADGQTEQVIVTGIRKVAAEIEKRTGMDFKQFTRSVLLAQGQFSEFLQAAADERAPLLEQITGTEQYSRISQQVHKRYVTEQEKIKQLQNDLDNVVLLNESQKKNLEKDRSDHQTRVNTLQEQFQKKTTWKQWLENISDTEDELKNIKYQVDKLTDLLELEKPAVNKLESGRKARLLSNEYRLVTDTRNQLEKLITTLENTEKERILADSKLKNNTTILEETQALFKQQMVENIRVVAVIKSVRLLDSDIKHQLAKKDILSDSVAKIKSEIETADKLLKISLEELSNCTTLLSEHKKYFETFPADEKLGEDLGKISSQLRSRDKLQIRIGELEKQHTFYSEGIDSHNSRRLLARKKTDELEAELTSIKQMLNENHKSRKSILNGDTFSDLLQRQFDLTQASNQLENWQVLYRQREEQQKELYTLVKKIRELDESENTLERQRYEISNRIAEAEKELVIHQKMTNKLHNINTLGKERRQLTEGAPCPLCGSTSHPYKGRRETEELDEQEKHLTKLTEKYEQLKESHTNKHTEIALLVNDRKNLNNTIESKNNLLTKTERSLNTLEKKILKNNISNISPVSFSSQLKLNEEKSKETKSRIDEIQSLQEDHHRLSTQINSISIELESHKKTIHHIDTLEAGDLSRKELCKQEHDIILIEEKQLLNELENLLRPYNKSVTETSKKLIHSLTEKADNWKKHHSSSFTLEKRILELKAENKNLTGNKELMSENLKAQQKNYTEELDTLNELLDKRFTLFSDRDPDKEEILSDKKFKKAQGTLEIAKDQYNASEKQSLVLKERLQTLKENNTSLKLELDKAENSFLSKLEDGDFYSEDDFTTALLSEKDFTELEQRIEALQNNLRELRVLMGDKKEKLLVLKEKQLCPISYDDLSKEIKKLTESISESERQIGSIETILTADKEKVSKYSKQAKILQEQEKEFNTWQLLHDLIGSGDGKKFRNFAQGITFDILISRSNKCLKKMNDRYLLVHSRERILEIDIIDNYQAGEIRSAKNLSGGESFIVSLSLALGLSAMSSENIKVDSLFLDEGFGTLDEDALETAISTLTSLHEEGRIIGIISHVASLKERIPTRINVIPGIGGRSTIQGPGINRM